LAYPRKFSDRFGPELAGLEFDNDIVVKFGVIKKLVDIKVLIEESFLDLQDQDISSPPIFESFLGVP
jgi:hypothetical protein